MDGMLQTFFGACKHGNIPLLKDILRYRCVADLEVNRNHHGETPLFSASIYNKIDTVVLLLELGFNIEAKDKYGNTPLFTASLHMNTSIVKILLDHGADTEVKNNRGETFIDYMYMYMWCDKDEEEMMIILEEYFNKKYIKPAK